MLLGWQTLSELLFEKTSTIENTFQQSFSGNKIKAYFTRPPRFPQRAASSKCPLQTPIQQ